MKYFRNYISPTLAEQLRKIVPPLGHRQQKSTVEPLWAHMSSAYESSLCFARFWLLGCRNWSSMPDVSARLPGQLTSGLASSIASYMPCSRRCAESGADARQMYSSRMGQSIGWELPNPSNGGSLWKFSRCLMNATRSC